MKMEYGIYDVKEQLVVAHGLSREEAYSYMETDAEYDDCIVRKSGSKWYRIADGLSVTYKTTKWHCDSCRDDTKIDCHDCEQFQDANKTDPNSNDYTGSRAGFPADGI